MGVVVQIGNLLANRIRMVWIERCKRGTRRIGLLGCPTFSLLLLGLLFFLLGSMTALAAITDILIRFVVIIGGTLV